MTILVFVRTFSCPFIGRKSRHQGPRFPRFVEMQWNMKLLFNATHLNVMSKLLWQIEKTHCSNSNCYQASRKGNSLLTIFWEAPEGSKRFWSVPEGSKIGCSMLSKGRFFPSKKNEQSLIKILWRRLSWHDYIDIIVQAHEKTLPNTIAHAHMSSSIFPYMSFAFPVKPGPSIHVRKKYQKMLSWMIMMKMVS